MLTLRIICALLFTIILSGCSTMQEASQPAVNKLMSWDKRHITLESIHSWNIEGMIAVHAQAANQSGSANLKWQQNGHNYTMLFYGPMGAGSQKLSGSAGKVVLQMADGKTATASSPEALLASQTGWRLPVSSMYYWVRGLPVPNLPVEKKLDKYSHVSEMRQQGWVIQFLRYTSANQVDLPTKIILSNPQMNVKMVIVKWNII